MHNGISSFLSWSDKDESYLQKREENGKKKKKSSVSNANFNFNSFKGIEILRIVEYEICISFLIFYNC